jgi:hypothetical protein
VKRIRIIAALVTCTLAILPRAATLTQATTVPNCTAAQQGVPRPCGTLTAIAAISSTDIWAVGTNTNVGTTGTLGSLIEHWNGHIWKSVPAPTAVGSTLRAVAAVSSSDVWAVGSGVIMHYDGRQWSITPTQQHFDLHAVAAISANNLWAVGTGSSHNMAVAQIVHWDGTQWRAAAIPTIPNSSLLGVAAVSADDVWAVGEFAPNVMKPLLLHWNGAVWRTVAFPPGHYPTGQASPQSMVVSDRGDGDRRQQCLGGGQLRCLGLLPGRFRTNRGPVERRPVAAGEGAEHSKQCDRQYSGCQPDRHLGRIGNRYVGGKQYGHRALGRETVEDHQEFARPAIHDRVVLGCSGYCQAECLGGWDGSI